MLYKNHKKIIGKHRQLNRCINIMHMNFRMQPARLSIFFKEHQFITSKRSELYGLTDFLGACGGLLGLFLGMSVLSIIEVIYYFTLRLGCSLRLRRHRKRKMRANKNLVDQCIPNIMIVNCNNASNEEKKDHFN